MAVTLPRMPRQRPQPEWAEAICEIAAVLGIDDDAVAVAMQLTAVAVEAHLMQPAAGWTVAQYGLGGEDEQGFTQHSVFLARLEPECTRLAPDDDEAFR